MNCETCKEKKTQAEPVSDIAFESMKATLERTNKRLWILALVLVLLLAVSNYAWWNYESQFTDEITTQEVWQDADNGINRFVGGDYYGAAESEDYYHAANP